MTSGLREQLMEMEAHNEDLDVLQEQRNLKAQAREEKAARQLAKGTLPKHMYDFQGWLSKM